MYEYCSAPPSNPCYVQPHARRVISRKVLASLASNGIGVASDSGRRVRPPRNAKEAWSVSALTAILNELDLQKRLVGKRGEKSRSVANLVDAAAAPRQSRLFATHSDELGLRVLEWLRHTDAHIFYNARLVEKCGLTTGVVAAAVQAAITAPVNAQPETFVRDSSGALVHAAISKTSP